MLNSLEVEVLCASIRSAARLHADIADVETDYPAACTALRPRLNLFFDLG